MTGLILAWLTGEGIICYRIITKEGRPPLPAELLATSGLFVLLALLAEAQSQLASMLAWGFVAAAFLNLWPADYAGGPLTAKKKTTPKAAPAK